MNPETFVSITEIECPDCFGGQPQYVIGLDGKQVFWCACGAEYEVSKVDGQIVFAPFVAPNPDEGEAA